MNYRLLKQSILIGILFILLVVGVVVAANWDAIRLLTHKNTPQEIAENVDETGAGQIGNDLSAFLKDDKFFDVPEENTGIQIRYGKPVSIIMNSVSQDLRVMIVNDIGKLETGAPFSIAIEGEGEYTDENQDGIIYIEHMRAGSYYVKLNKLDGYAIDDTKIMINVKDSISYQVLPDIKCLVLKESQVDVSVEDTEKKDAIADSDDTETTELEAYSDKGKLGIDVSRWNEDIDWEEVARDGIEYAIIRCGYRGSSSGSLIEDSKFKRNMMDAASAGIKVGVYFFSQAITEKEAIEEASMVDELCKYFYLEYPVFIDSESAGGDGRADDLSVEERTAITSAFCKTIKNAGYDVGIYASKNWFYDKLDMSKLESYNVWLAEYRDEPLYEGNYDMWQYTSKGNVNGVPTRVDLNISYLD